MDQRDFNKAIESAKSGNVNALNNGYRKLNTIIRSTEGVIENTVNAVNKKQESIRLATEAAERQRQTEESIKQKVDEKGLNKNQLSKLLQLGYIQEVYKLFRLNLLLLCFLFLLLLS